MTIRALKEAFGPDKAKTLIIRIEDGESVNKISRITRWNGSNCLVEILEDGHKVNLSLDKRHVSVFSEPSDPIVIPPSHGHSLTTTDECNDHTSSSAPPLGTLVPEAVPTVSASKPSPAPPAKVSGAKSPVKVTITRPEKKDLEKKNK